MSPESKPSLDLDALERQDDDRGPFTFTLGGHEYLLAGPMDLDYRDLVDAMVAAQNSDLVGAMNKILFEDVRDAFWLNRIPAYKMEALLGAYMKHYQLDRVDLDSGKSGASSASSRGTARPSKRTSRSGA